MAWILNPDDKVVERIKARLTVTGGQCPCVPKPEWNEDTLCECKDFREGRGCHCSMYVEEF